MAWDRVTELSIGETGTGLLISDLDMDFSIEKTMSPAENTAKFTIYNAKKDTVQKILKQGNNCIFKCGYKDEIVSTIFAGSIVQSIHSKQGVDTKCDIVAIGKSSRIELRRQNISISYGPETLLSKPLRDIAALLGIVLHGESNAAIRLPNGWCYVGAVNGAIRYVNQILVTNGCSMYVDNDELVVYKKGVASRFNIVYLTYTGGLLYVKDVTEAEVKDEKGGKNPKPKPKVKKKLEFETIMMSQLQPNAPIVFDTPNLKGNFIIEKLTFEGNNYGGKFGVKGVAFI
jgi:hypothetical protein